MRYHQVDSYITKDGSSIKELMHPDQHGAKNQSLAEATVPQGVKTRLHYHKVTEELYHIVEGEGVMTLGKRTPRRQCGRYHLHPAGHFALHREYRWAGAQDTVLLRPRIFT